MKVYLSGPIENCSYTEVWEWRTKARKLLEIAGFEVIDVAEHNITEFNDADNSDEIAEALVEYDLDKLAECDAVLCFAWKPSVGTSQELVYAKNRQIYDDVDEEYIDSPLVVATVVPNSSLRLSWLRYHSDLVTEDLSSAVDFLKDYFT